MNRTRTIIKYTGIALLLLVLAAAIAVQTPVVQTRLTQAVIDKVKDKVDGDISLGSVHFKLFNTVLLQDIVIVDRAPVCEQARDTLLQLSALSVRFSISSLIGHDDVRIKSVRLRDGQFNLVVENVIGDGPDKQNNLKRMFHLVSKDQEKPLPEKNILQVKNIFAKGVTFRLQNFINPPSGKPSTAVQWNDLEFNDICLRASKFKVGGTYITADIGRLSGTEKSGWNIDKVSSHVQIGHRKVFLQDLHYEDGSSTLDLDLSMLGKAWDYKSFAKKVGICIDMKQGNVSLLTLSRFVASLPQERSTSINLAGGVEGYFHDLNFNKLHIAVRNSCLGTTISGNFNTDHSRPNFSIKLSNTKFSTAEIQKYLKKFVPKAKVDLTRFGQGQIYYVTLDASGTPDKIKAVTDIRQGFDRGHVSADLDILNATSYKGSSQGGLPLSVDGFLKVENLDLNALMGISQVGNISLDTYLGASLPTAVSPLDAKLDSLNVHRIRWRGCDLHDICGNLHMEGRDITADLHARDKALDADVSVWSDQDSYNISSAIRNADLSAMNLDKRAGSSAGANLYCRVDKDFKQLSGKASLSDLRLTTAEGTSIMDNLTVTIEQDEDIYDVLLNSSLAHGSFSGNKKAFSTDLTLYGVNPLLAFVKSGLYVENGTSISGEMGLDGKVSASITSGRIALEDNYIKNFRVDASGKLDSLVAKITAGDITFSENSLCNNVIDITRNNNVFDVRYRFDNSSTDLWVGDINARMSLEGGKDFDISILPSTLNTGEYIWEIDKSAISKKGSRISIDSLTIKSSDQWFKLNGDMDKEGPATLYADIHNFDIEPWNRFIKKNLDLMGRLSVNGAIKSPLSKGVPEMEMAILVDSLQMCGIDMGQVHVDSRYSREQGILKATIDESIVGRKAVSAEVDFTPADKNLNALISLNRLPIGFTQPFVPNLFSKVDGLVSGEINVSGPLDKLNFSSRNCRLDEGGLEIAFTQVYYFLDGTFKLNNDGVFMEAMNLRDRFDAKGTLEKGLVWNRGRDMKMDLDIFFKEAEVLNTNLANTKAKFYGNVFATGSVNLGGKFGANVLSANAATKGNSEMHFVLSKDTDVSRSNLLTFIDPYQTILDPYEEILERYRKKNEKEKTFTFILDAMVDPSLAVHVDMGSGGFAAGMEGRGSGEIDLKVEKDKGFSILGDYNIQEGSFGVNASNLVIRNFSIKNGSSIKFGGDIFNSNLDISASYETKASISALIADTTSVSNRRQVLCGMEIRNKLNNPDIKFSIEIPDLDPAHKSAVESALSTEDKVQRQFLSLLLSNSFLPDEQSGIVNSTSLIYSNVSDMMANQVNNIFDRLNIPLDLGLNYQPGDNGKSMFDVALSTQLFNNRVIIGGTLGNRPDKSTNTQTLFGDIDIQYKVNRTGTLRVKAFSHSADQYSNFLDNSQRNGLGVSWQQEFNHFVPWITNLFQPKAKKEENAIKEYQKSKETQTITVHE